MNRKYKSLVSLLTVVVYLVSSIGFIPDKSFGAALIGRQEESLGIVDKTLTAPGIIAPMDVGAEPAGAWTVAQVSENKVLAARRTPAADTTPPEIIVPPDVTKEATGLRTPANIGRAETKDRSRVSLFRSGPFDFPVGVTIVTWTAIDASGNKSTATQKVTITDTTAPILKVPMYMQREATAVKTPVDIGQATATDIFGVTITNNAPEGFPLGTTVVTWTATDANGNKVTGTQSVTILDKTKPKITAPADIRKEATAIKTPVNIGRATATDIFRATITNNAPASYPLGTTNVTWAARDANGRCATATQKVTIVDTTAPRLTIPGDITREATGIKTPVNIGRATATDIFGANVTNDAPLSYPIGTTIVTWTARDPNGNKTTATQKVTITDKTAPVIMAPDDIVKEATGIRTPADIGKAAATDIFGVKITNDAPKDYPVGVTTVTWTALDANGNKTTATQKVTITDRTTPVITPPADIVKEATDMRTPVSIGDAFATDIFEVTVTNDAPKDYPLGVTTVTWTALDANGNKSTATQKVTITDKTVPVITAPADIVKEATGIRTPADIGTATATDIFGATITNDAPSDYPAGANIVTWTAADANGNKSTYVQKVTIIDTTAPIVTAPDDIAKEATGIQTQVDIGTATATDIFDVTITSNALADYPLGTTIVMWTAVDEHGNKSTAAQRVTITDKTSPALTIPDDISTEATGIKSPVSVGVATATDIFSATVTNDAPVVYLLGTTTVTWTAEDANGNKTTGMQKITVVDTTPPGIIAPPDVTKEATAVRTPVSIGTAIATDIFDVTMTSDAPSDYGVGVTTVTWVATDANGNKSTAIQKITIIDTTPPAVTVPADITKEATDRQTPVNIGILTATDIFDVTVTSDAPTDYPLGVTTVTWTAMDSNGNKTAATQKVTIVDTTAPTLTVPADITYEATAVRTAVYIGEATATDIFNVAITNDVPSDYPLGATTVTWTATDSNGNKTTSTQKVTIVDTTVPTITAPTNITVEATAIKTPVAIGTATASDIFGVTVTNDAPSAYPLGETLVTWTATDPSGNKSTVAQKVTVVDTTAPTISVPANVMHEATDVQTAVTIGNATATDIFDVTVTNDAPTVYPLGVTTVIWTATDTSGNSSKETQKVTIVDTTAPIITAPTDITKEATAVRTAANIGAATATDIFELTIANDAPSDYPLGETTVTWTATDITGNKATSTQKVTIVDTTAPTITTPTNITVEATALLTPVDIGVATTNDIFGSTAVSNAPISYPVGTTAVTWTATDLNGNKSTATQQVTIIDTTVPFLTAPPDVTKEAAAVRTAADIGIPIASDIFGITVASNAPNDYPFGETTVTWTATDANGNKATTTQKVTIIDTTAPSLTAPADLTIEAVSARTPANIGTATADDIFGVTITNDAPIDYPIGTTAVTWTATDDNGNKTTAIQKITVTDTTAPSLTAPADAAIEATAIRTPVNIGAASVADASHVTIANDAPIDYPVGTTVVTWTATDEYGNSSTSVQLITITDNTPPALTVPADISLEATSVQNLVDLGTATATDIFQVNISSNALESYALGETTVTWTAADANGNTITATQRVTIADTTTPNLTAPEDVIVEATGILTPANIGVANATDIFPVTLTNNAQTSYPLGDTTVIWTAADSNGNKSVATQKVTIIDTIAPRITAPSNVTVEATSINTPADIGRASVTDIFEVAVANDAPESYPLGDTTVTWTATDSSGNRSTTIQKVTIVDTTAPIITVPSNVTVEATGTNTPADIGMASANDIFGATVTSDAPASYPLGDTTVTWTALDANGNTSRATQKVTVTDTNVPTITAPEDIIVEATGVNTPADIGTATANDIFAVTVTNNAPASYPLGDTTITWTALDANGNTATATQKVTLVDTTLPVITVPPDVSALATNVRTVADIGVATATDIFSVTVTSDAPNDYPLGTTAVTWTATDCNGNVTTATQQVTMNPVAAPQNITVTTTTNTLAISWAAADGATGYDVILNTTGEPVSTTELTYTYTGLTPNTEYIYLVRAKNLAGPGAYSIPASIYTEEEAPPDPIALSATKVSAGASHVLAITPAKTVLSWGYNKCGKLGDGTIDDRITPVEVQILTGVKDISSSNRDTDETYGHSLALKEDGTVWAWGSNDNGRLGDGTTDDKAAPTQVTGLTDVSAIVAGGGYSLALKTDGTVWAWGANDRGQLGNGTTTDSSVPVQVAGLSNIQAITSGGGYSLALKADGTVWVWGAGYTGLTQITDLADVTKIAVGKNFSAALKNDGTVWTWGNNELGQLGDGTVENRSANVVQAIGLPQIVDISAGSDHVLAIAQDGTAWGWGNNAYGQLGLDTSVYAYKCSPVAVGESGLSNVSRVSAGEGYSVAIKNDGSVWSWGNNNYGQLGVGTATYSIAPTQVFTVGIDETVLGLGMVTSNSFINLNTTEFSTGVKEVPIEIASKKAAKRLLVKLKADKGPSPNKGLKFSSKKLKQRIMALDVVNKGLSISQLKKLAKTSEVEMVEEDGEVKAAFDKITWNISQIHAEVAEQGFNGNGIKVAVFDTGIDTQNTDLRVVGGISCVDGVTSYSDDNGHGTAMAGILAALDNDQGLLGVSPGIELYSVKVLDKNGIGSYSGIIQGIEWAIANDIDIISMSFGGTQYSKILEDEINLAHSKGILIVAAAGNTGMSEINYPAKYANVICVGAVDTYNKIAPFSNRGSEMDIVAPGVNVESVGIGNRSVLVSGTSPAVPHVAGVAAQVLGIRKDMGVDQLTEILTKSATPVQDMTPDSYGWGVVDSYASILGINRDYSGYHIDDKYAEIPEPDVGTGGTVGITAKIISENYQHISQGSRTTVSVQFFEAHSGCTITVEKPEWTVLYTYNRNIAFAAGSVIPYTTPVLSAAGTYKIRYYTGNHDFDTVLTIYVDDTTAPTTPGNFNYSSKTDTSITLSWTDSSDNVGVTGYELYNNGNLLTTVTGTTLTRSNLQPNSTYTYALKARDAAGNRSAGTSVSVTTNPDTTRPTVPSNMRYTGRTATSVSLAWDASTDVSGIDSYEIYIGEFIEKTVPGTETGYEFKGLLPLTTYSFAVRAKDGANNTSNQSNYKSVTTLADTTAPIAPTYLNGSATVTGMTLTWTAATDDVGVQEYQVFRNGVRIGTSAGTTYLDSGLDPNTSYTYKVRAKDKAGNVSGDSNVFVKSTLPDTESPSKPSLGGTTTTSSVTLSWNASTDNVRVSRYEVYKNNTKIATKAPQETSHTDSNLPGNTTYSYFVRAYDASGNYSQSDTASYKTVQAADTSPPSTPTNLTESHTYKIVTLNWTASTDASGIQTYTIYRNNEICGASATNFYEDKQILPDTQYSYYVTATDRLGYVSGSSNTIYVRTDKDAEAPAPPSNLTGMEVSNGEIILNWFVSADNVITTGYNVYRDNICIAQTQGTGYNDRTPSTNTWHNYYVKAKDAAGNISEQSDTVRVIIDTQAPTVPRNIKLAALSATSATLTWDASTDYVGAKWYELTMDPEKPIFVEGTSYTNRSLVPGASYTCVVKAVDAAGNRSSSDSSVSFTADQNDNTRGTATTVTPGESKFGIIDFQGDADYYKFIATTGGNYTIKTTGSTDTYGYLYNSSGTCLAENDSAGGDDFRIIYSLTAGQTYYVKVRHYSNTAWYFGYTLWITASALDTEAPSAPSSLTSVSATSDTAKLTWTPSSDNVGVVGYEIYRDGVKSTTATVTVAPNIVTCIDTGLMAGQSYTYYVIAKDAKGNSSQASNTASVNTLTGDDYPSSLAAVASVNPISVGTLNGNINYKGDSDYFKFKPETTGFYAIQTFGTCDTAGILYNGGTWAEITEDDDSGDVASGNKRNFLITQQLYSNNYYYICVKHHNSTGTGAYTLKVQYTPVNVFPLMWITNSAQITMRFGKLDEICSDKHQGVDIQGTAGDDIRSAMNGQVVYVGTDSFYGNAVFINGIYQGRNIQTRYAHLQDSSTAVTVGQQVMAGDVIGKMGNTGAASGGYVVYIELLESTDNTPCKVNGTNGKKVDPLTYFQTVYASDEYLSKPFAITIDTTSSVSSKSIGSQSVSASWDIVMPYEDLSNPDTRYKHDYDLNDGEVYLRKAVENYASRAGINKEDLETKNVLIPNNIARVTTVNLNGRTKVFPYEGYGVRNVNGRIVVKVEELYSYFFIYPAYYNNTVKGAVVLLSHGYNSNVDAFKKTVAHMADENFIDYGTIIARSGVTDIDPVDLTPLLTRLGISQNLSYHDTIKALVNKGKYVMIRTQFTDNKDSHAAQIAELQMLINWFIPSDAQVILVGHSKGGLVSLGVASDNSPGWKKVRDRILKTITVDTPYLANTEAELCSLKENLQLFDNSPAIEDLAGHTSARENIRNQWNQNGGLAYAIGINVLGSDFVVGIDSQLGGDFDRINKREFSPWRQYGPYEPWNYTHLTAPERIEISREIKRLCIGISTEFK